MVDLGTENYSKANTQVQFTSAENALPLLELLTPEFGDTVEDFSRKLVPTNVVSLINITESQETDSNTLIEIDIMGASQGVNIGGNTTLTVTVSYEVVSEKSFNYSFNQRDAWGGMRTFVNVTDMVVEGPPIGEEGFYIPSRLFVEYEFTIVEA